MSGKFQNTEANSSYNLKFFSQDRTLVGNKTTDDRLTLTEELFSPYTQTELLLPNQKLSVAKFNMIQMYSEYITDSIDDEIFMKVRYFGSSNSDETPSQEFKLLLPQDQNFFQQLPIQNKFVDFIFENNTGSNVVANVDIAMTTNPTWQPAVSVGMPQNLTGDLQVAQGIAIVNDHRTDLVGEMFKNNYRRVVSGVIDYSDTSAWTYPINFGSLEKKTPLPSDGIMSFSNVAVRVKFENDHASDNVPVYIQGLDSKGNRSVERLSSNTATSGLHYSVIDYATIVNNSGLGLDGLNGNIQIRADPISGSDRRMNTIVAGANTTQTLQFFTSKHSHSVINNLSLTGFVPQGFYKFELFCVKITDGTATNINSKRCIYSCGIYDNNNVNISRDLNIKIGDENGRAYLVYGQITSGTAHRTGDGMYLSATLDITEVFSTNDNVGLTANSQFT